MNGQKTILFCCGVMAWLLLTACAAPLTPPTLAPPTPAPTGTQSNPLAPPAVETPIQELPLAGPVADSRSELSGLAWHGDALILLPQYPERMGGNLFALDKAEILAALTGEQAGPLTPRPIPLDAPGLNRLPGYEGLEAIAFAGDRVYATVETRRATGMEALLLAGTIAADGSMVHLDVDRQARIPAQAPLANYSDEALVVWEETLVTLYEANGVNVNPRPVAHVFRLDLTPLAPLPFPPVEYRITDATGVDAAGVFWAINYLFPGDRAKLQPGPDRLQAPGSAPGPGEAVERLVAFRFTGAGVALADMAPVQLVLAADGAARNWEGVVRLDHLGFLLVTDRHPRTMLAFAPARKTWNLGEAD